MNIDRNGNLLSNARLLELAVEGGASREKLSNMAQELHKDALIRSHLLMASQEIRFAMWARGELHLDSSRAFWHREQSASAEGILAFREELAEHHRQRTG